MADTHNPLINDLISSLTISEDQAQSEGGVQLDADVTVQNPDSTGWAGGHFTLHLSGATTADSFTLNTGSGITVSDSTIWVDGTAFGTITSDGSAGSDFTVSFAGDRFVDRTEVNRVLESIYLHNSSDAPPAGARDIAVTVVDSETTLSTTQHIAYTITPTIDAPIINNLTSSLTISEDQAQGDGVQLDADVTVQNPDSTGWAGGHFTLHLTNATSADSFTLNGGDGVTVSGSTIMVDGHEFGTITSNGSAGSDFTVSFAGDRFVDRSEVSRVLESVYAHNSSDAPPSGARDIAVTVVDSETSVSTTQHIAYTITPTIDAPIINNLTSSLAVTEAQASAGVQLDADVTVANPDSTGWAGGDLTVHLDSATVADSFVLSGGTGVTVSGSTIYVDGHEFGTITSDGSEGGDLSISFADDRFVDRTEVNRVLESVYVHNTSDNNTLSARNITVTVTDSESVSTSQSLAYSISHINHAPEETLPDALVQQNGSVDLGHNIVADPDIVDILTVDLSALDGTLDVSGASGNIIFSHGEHIRVHGTAAQIDALHVTYTPDDGFSGHDTLIESAIDNHGGSSAKVIDIFVNAPPTLDYSGSVSLQEDGYDASGSAVTSVPSATVTLSASDPDERGPVTYNTSDWTETATGSGIFSESATYGSVVLNTNDGTLTYNIDNSLDAVNSLAFSETVHDDVTVSFNDVDGGVSSNTVTFDIHGANDMPTTSGSNSTTVSEGSGTVTLGAIDNAHDAESDTLSVTGLPDSLPSGVTYDSGSQTFTFDANDAAYNHLAAGSSTDVVVDYTVSDGHGGTVSDSVTFHIDGTNDAPTIGTPSGSLTVNEDTTLSSLGVSVADADDNDVLTVTVSASHGTLSFGSGTLESSESAVSGVITLTGSADEVNHDLALLHYQDDLNLNGSETLYVNVIDSHEATSSSEVTIDVTSVNDAPVIHQDGELGVDENGSMLLGLSVTDADNDTVSVTVAVDHGTLSDAVSDSGASATIGDDLTTLTVSGTVAQVNAYLAGLNYDAGTFTDGDGHNTGGMDAVHVTVEDGHSGNDSQDYDITVNHVDIAPTLSGSLGSVAATEDGSSVTASGLLSNVVDADGDPLSITSYDSLPSGVTYNSGSGTFTLDPSDAAYQHLAAGETASVTVNYTVSDDHSNSVSDSVTFTVTGVNDDPTISLASGAVELNAGGDNSVSGISVHDADTNDIQTVDVTVFSGVLSVSSVSGVTETFYGEGQDHLQLIGTAADINVALESLQYSSTLPNGGSDTMTISTDDGHGGSDIQELELDINGHPVFSASTPGSLNYAENSTDAVGTFAASDPNDGDTITYSLTGDNADLFNIDSSTGEVTFKASPDFETPQGFEDGNTYLISVVATDQLGASETTNVVVSVTDVNEQAEVTAPESVSATEDVSFSFTGETGISISDPDSGTITVELSVNHGTLTDSYSASGLTVSAGSGSDIIVSGTVAGVNEYLSHLTYQDDANANGSATLTVTTTDSLAGHGDNVQTGTITIDVAAVDDAPVASGSISATVAEGSGEHSLSAIGNITDVDSTEFTVSDLPDGLPSGVTYDSGSQTFTLDTSNAAYDHLASGSSTDVTVNFTVSDGNTAVSDSVTFHVTGVNDAPTVSDPIAVSATEGSGTVFATALSNAADADDGSSLHAIVDTDSLPAGVTYSGGTFTFDPTDAAYNHLGAGESASVTVNYTVSDEFSATVSDSVVFTVYGTNDAPTVSGTGAVSGTEDTGFSLSLNVADADTNDTITVTLSGSHVTFDGSATEVISGTVADVNSALAALTATPDANYNDASGSASISYTVTDGHIGSPLTGTINVSLEAVNDSPVLSGSVTGASATEGGAAVHSSDALSNASDVDGDTLSVVTGTLPAGVTYDTGTHQFTLDPANAAYDYLSVGDSATVTVNYDVSDGTTTTSDSVSFSITGINDKPINITTGTIAVGENTTGTNPGHTFSNDELAVSDADLNDTETVDVSVLHGILTQTGVLGTVTGSGTAHIKLTGTISQINADLATLHYTPTSGFTGDDKLTISDKDNHSATDVDFVTLHVVPPPVFSGSTTFTAAENSTSSTSVTATSTDGFTPTLSIVGGTESGSFTISGSTVTLAAQDYENALGHGSGSETYSVIVQATDHEGGVSTETLNFTVTNVDEAPAFASASLSVNYAENGVGSVGTFSASDPEAASVTYSLTGADASLFSISTGGVVTFVGSPDYESAQDSGTNNVYNVNVVATDGTAHASTESLVITVTNVDEAPVFSTNTVAFNGDEGTGTIHTFTATDPESATVDYSLGGSDSALFSITSSGALAFTADHGAGTYHVDVVASDQTSHATTEHVTITVPYVVPEGADDAVTFHVTDDGTGSVVTYNTSDTSVFGNDTLDYSASVNVFNVDSDNVNVSVDSGGHLTYTGDTVAHFSDVTGSLTYNANDLTGDFSFGASASYTIHDDRPYIQGEAEASNTFVEAQQAQVAYTVTFNGEDFYMNQSMAIAGDSGHTVDVSITSVTVSGDKSVSGDTTMYNFTTDGEASPGGGTMAVNSGDNVLLHFDDFSHQLSGGDVVDYTLHVVDETTGAAHDVHVVLTMDNPT